MNALIFFLFFTISQSLLVNACKNHKECHECIRDANICAWCTSIESKYDKEPRCRAVGSIDPTWCAGKLDIPANATVTMNKSANFSSKSGHVVQLKPQMYDITLRPGQPQNFTFSFQGAKDYPVDLYMLLDASKTMNDIKKNLSSHSEKIYKVMQGMTKDVYMGFGTFIDKNAAPYTLKPGSNLAYSFRNRLNLTSNYKTFEEVVNDTEFGTNYDIPEGGFDALAQVMACNLGWREKSRKIVVFLTDSVQHVVGDGRSAGIFQPFDGKCHTNAEGIYTKELEMDYPSVTNINVLAAHKEVIIIFTLSSHETESFYTDLKDAIRGSRVAVLSESDIVTQLTETYKEISTNIKLEVQVQSGNSSNWEIKFDPDCTKAGNSQCKVETGEQRDFTGTITLSEYYGQGYEVIDISIQGVKENLTLSVNVINCTCEAKKEKSPHCFDQTLQCGTCKCDANMHGSHCRCEKGNNNNHDDSSCIESTDPGSRASSPKLCNGKGECECGLCKCENKRFGKFCECDERCCPGYNDGQICGGHGTCECSGEAGTKEVCSCNKGWALKPGAESHGCVCEEANNLCSTGNNTNCNNRGKCICNTCACNDAAKWDKRIEIDSMCNIKPCPSCHSLQCSVVRTCVRCRLDSQDCVEECTGIFLEDDKIYDVLPNNLSSIWNLCDHEKVETGCYTKFAYRYDDEAYRIMLLMQEDTDCAENYYKYGGILLVTLLLVGILTLLAWKGLTYYQDVKEYKKFEEQNKEFNEASVNPLYDEPRTFRNPAFKKSFSG